jgi:hypothetical protein
VIIVDDILLFPVRSLFWIFREIHNAAQQALETEAEDITTQLSELYMMLETGKITESEFDAKEKELLDRLDKIQGDSSTIDGEEQER